MSPEALSNDSGILLPDHDADPERELQAEWPGTLMPTASAANPQLRLVADPEAGSLIPGTGGLRKIRWQGSGRGKRGGVRVIYYWAVRAEVVLMLLMYPKSELDDLTSDQKKALAALVRKEFK